MPTLSESLGQLLAGIRKRETAGQAAVAEVEKVLTGQLAIAAVEARVAESVGFSTAPAPSVGRETLLSPTAVNLLGRHIAALWAADARDGLMAAIGASAAGQRATAFLGSGDLLGAQDQLALAAAQHLPLVAHVTCSSPGSPTVGAANGHGAYHASSETGCIQLFACNVQEAVDLSLIARHAAELSLVPVLVAIDDEQARAIEDVRLPSPDLVRRFIGDPDDRVPTPTAAQALLFGRNRRRLPRWHDLDRPALHGAGYDPHARALALAAHKQYFAVHVAELLQRAMARFAELTSRELSPLLEVALDGADIVIVAQGAVAERAAAVVDQLRRERVRVGLVGIRCVRPFPGDQLAALLRGRKAVLVLERDDALLATDPPLIREIRAALQRALAEALFEPSEGPKTRRWSPKQLPRLHSVIYGLGGQALRPADLIDCCRRTSSLSPQVYLGVDFVTRNSAYPIRQAMIDELRRERPDLKGLNAPAATSDAAGTRSAHTDGAITFATYRRSGRGALGVVQQLGEQLYELLGGRLRGEIGADLEAWQTCVVDRLSYAPERVPPPPADSTLVDVAIVTRSGIDPRSIRADSFRKGSVLIFEREIETDAPWTKLPAALLEALAAAGVVAYTCIVPPDSDEISRQERLVGALLAAADESGKLSVSTRRLRAVRTRQLEHLQAAESDRRLSALIAGYEQTQRLKTFPRSDADDRSASPEPSWAARHVAQNGGVGAPMDDLARFWNTAGVIHASGEVDALSADPFLSGGAIPPLSAGFRRFAAGETLPQLDPSLCTGCGRCWASCPDGAIGPVALTPQRLIEGGMAIAKDRGSDTDPLRMLLSKLGPRVGTAFAAADPPLDNAAAALEAPFAELLQRASLPAQRANAVSTAFRDVLDHIGNLQIVRADPFWATPEAQKPGSGTMLSLAINPDTCKSCGICVAVCEPRALSAQPHTPTRAAAARKNWHIWERLTDSSTDTIHQVSKDEAVGPLAGILLSRRCLQAAVGGDGAEAGSGAKIALRALLAVGAHELHDRSQEQIKRIEQLRDELAERIRQELLNSLPTSDIDALSRGIEQLDRSHTSLTELTARVERIVESRSVDVDRLHQFVDAARDLADLHWKLTRGVHALGRAPLSLVLAPRAHPHGLGVYPHNPFQVPVTIDASGRSVSLARGLLEGQLSQAVEVIGATRRAQLGLQNPTEAALTDANLKHLTYADLTAEERTLCPPLVLVTGSLDGDALVTLLRSDLPIKLLILSDAGDARLQPLAPPRLTALQLLALGDHRAFVVQSSIAFPGHLYAGLSAALKHAGPALIHVHAPSPTMHGFASDCTIDQARLAVITRSFPLFVLDPTGSGLFGRRLRLDGNPQLDRNWVPRDGGGFWTPADWSVREQRFAQHFGPIAQAPSLASVAEYLDRAPAARQGCTPVVTVGDPNAPDPQQLRVSGEAVAMAQQRLEEWRVLQELSGLVTPFTERVRADAEQAVRETHEQTVSALLQQHAQQVVHLQTVQAAAAARRVRDQLLRLAGYDVPTEGAS